LSGNPEKKERLWMAEEKDRVIDPAMLIEIEADAVVPQS